MLTISAEFIVCLILISVMSVQVLCDKCPPISDGDSSPYCTCKYGPPYDEVTNTCPDPKCPPESIDFGYPDCFCFERNSDYSAYTNECFRVCPVNSSGYWPNCTCDDKLAQFDKKNFECRKCPEDSAKGDIYPNCNCDKVGPYNQYENKCVKCPQGSEGVFPNCTCIDERMNFNQFISKCQICPHGSSGKVPTCVCDNGSEYYVYGNYCIGCPYGSTGNFPNCKCRDGGYFDGKSCRNCGFYGNCTCEGNKVYDEKDGLCLECPPEQSTGTYPYCVCEEPFQYNKKTKRCVKCPKDLNGIFPNCECSNGLFETTFGVCIECPVDATGIFPDCKCQREDHIFSAYINECYIKCGNGSEGIHPKCKCSEPGTYYDPTVFTCKSNIGRKCPPTSVGVGPDCLCVQKHRTFFEKYWNCLQQDPASTAFLVPLVCPDRNDKWPQCSTEVDPRVLRSLIG